MIASLYHFYDIDIEPLTPGVNGRPGKYRLTASAYNRKLVFNGYSRRDVCERFVNTLLEEGEKKNADD